MEVMADVEDDDPEEWARLRDMAVRVGWLVVGPGTRQPVITD